MIVAARPPMPACLLAALALLSAAAGCKPEIEIQPPLPAGGMSIYQLGTALNMRVSSSTSRSALLENSYNRLLVFGPPRPSLTLNGRPVETGPGILSNGEYLVVPKGLASTLRPQLRQPQAWTARPDVVSEDGVSTIEPAPTVEPRPEQPAPTPKPTGKVIVIDPGHGGTDIGAPNLRRTSGPHEKDINLDTALRVRDALRAYGHTVIMTRQSDATVDLHDRGPIANRNKADLFVSIHADSAPNKSADGFTVYVAHQASRKSTALGQAIVSSLKAARVPSRGLKPADYVVLVETRCPAVLVEQGFMSNAAELARLSTPSYRQDLATAIAAGIHQALRK